MKLVSVIVPVYNVEKYLTECVDSLLRQTYKNLEIILVDDGSNDSSGRICDRYAQTDPRVKVIHKENSGLGFARNSGLEVATGEFVTFIDSDDRADKDLVELLMKGIEEAAADTCIGGFQRVTENGEVNHREVYRSEVFRKRFVYDKLFARMLGSAPDSHDAIRMSVWNVLYSMEIIRKHNIRFPSERVFISEDIIWDSEYYKYAECVKVIDSAAYNYRITPGSLTQKYKPKMLDMICVLYCEMEQRLKGDKDKIVRLKRQFFVNLRTCIRQENSPDAPRSTALRVRLDKILNDPTVVRIVNSYPIKKIQWKARVFLIIVRHRMASLLTLMLKFGLV